MADFKKRIRSVNAKILNLEKRYGKDSQIVKRAYQTLNMAQGTKNKTRYSMPKNPTTRQLAKIDRGLSLVERSKYTSAKGRKEIKTKAMSSFNETRGLSDVQLERMYDYFENSVDWNRLRDLSDNKYSSEYYRDAVQEQIEAGLSNEDIDKLTLTFFRRQGLKYERNRDIKYAEYVNKILGQSADTDKLRERINKEYVRVEKKYKNPKYIR